MSKELDARLAALIERCDETDRLIVDTRRFADLEAENVELRELVRNMYAVMVEDAANCDVTYPEQFDDRMRELGIEVDA